MFLNYKCDQMSKYQHDKAPIFSTWAFVSFQSEFIYYDYDKLSSNHSKLRNFNQTTLPLSRMAFNNNNIKTHEHINVVPPIINTNDNIPSHFLRHIMAKGISSGTCFLLHPPKFTITPFFLLPKACYNSQIFTLFNPQTLSPFSW